jgi:hypothetical protein
MKYMKRLRIYKSKNCTFDPKTIEAYSYVWWKFVSVIEGKVIFNNYRYSNTTSKHQRKIDNLMFNLGIKIDYIIECSVSLDGISTLNNLEDYIIETLNEFEYDQSEKLLRKRIKAKERYVENKNKQEVFRELQLL